MKNEKLLSIIIPVYKVEEYINRCIGSILETLDGHEVEYEIVLINDGSPDNCGKICDGYAKKHQHIKVIHKNNGGLSDARNHGINESGGKYIAFVDSDDWVNSSFLDVLDALKQNPDIKLFQTGYNFVNSEEQIYGVRNHKKFGTLDFNSGHAKFITRFAMACNKIVCREIILNNDLFFKVGMIHEDFEWSFRVWHSVDKVQILDIKYYMYFNLRPGNIMSTASIDKTQKFIIPEVHRFSELLKTKNLSKHKRDALLVYLSIPFYTLIATSQKSERTRVVKILKENKKHIRYPKGYVFKAKLSWFFMKIFGIRFSLRLINILKK